MKRVFKALAVLSTVLVIGGIAVNPAESEPLDVSSLAWEPWGCVTDLPCISEQHKMAGGNDYGPDFHDCLAGAAHFGPKCGVAYAPEQVIGASPAMLARMIATPESNVVYNSARNAVQVIGCDGSVVAHLPFDRSAITS